MRKLFNPLAAQTRDERARYEAFVSILAVGWARYVTAANGLRDIRRGADDNGKVGREAVG